MNANPLTEERLNKLRAEAEQFLTDFGKLYGKSYGVSLYEKIKKEEQNKQPTHIPYRLSHRDFDSVPRTSPLFSGECFVKTGEGAGSFGGVNKRFIAENCSYGINIFSDEQSYTSKRQPLSTISTAGFTNVSEVSRHYKDDLHQLARGLGLTNEEEEAMSAFSRYSWALAHPQRKNYVFQLHPATGLASLCWCCEWLCGLLGRNTVVDPSEEVDVERRRELMKLMTKCINKAQPRDLETVHGMAFERACQKIPDKISSLENWKDNGTEEEILFDMLMTTCVPDLRDSVLAELKGPASIKVAAWYKARGVIQATCLAVLKPTWAKIIEGTQALEAKLSLVIRPALSQVVKVELRIQEKIKSMLLDKVGDKIIDVYVTPYIGPMIKAFDEPLQQGFKRGRTMLIEKLDLAALPADKIERNRVLDSIPRTEDNIKNIVNAAEKVVSPLNQLKKNNIDVFQELEVSDLQDDAEQQLLETLDAAVYTVEVRLDTGLTADDAMKDQLLQDYDNDSRLGTMIFMQEMARNILIPAFKRLVGPAINPQVEQLNDEIPEEMRDFLSADQIYDEFLDFFVGEPINRMVETTYSIP